jgi:hypothetical protein
MSEVSRLLEVQVFSDGTLQGLKEFLNPKLDAIVAVVARDPAQERHKCEVRWLGESELRRVTLVVSGRNEAHAPVLKSRLKGV